MARRDAGGLVVDAEPRRRREGAHARDPDAEVAGERQLDAAAVDAAVQPGDRRHRERLERVAERGQRVLRPVGAGDVPERGPGAEAPAAPGQDQRAQLVPARPVGEERGQLPHRRLVERVVRLGAVEGDAGDRPVERAASDHASNSAKTGAWSRRRLPAAHVAGDPAAAGARREVGGRPDVVEPPALVGRLPVRRAVAPPGIEPARRGDGRG